MNEERSSRKKAHELEMANLRNITEKLRAERNDAQVKIQVQNRLLHSITEILEAVENEISNQDTLNRIRAWREKNQKN